MDSLLNLRDLDATGWLRQDSIAPEPDEPELHPSDFLKGARSADPAHKPLTISEVGVRQSFLEELALKTLYLSGPFTLVDLAKQTKLSFEVANELFLRLRGEMLCQVNGMRGNIPHISITNQGRTRAADLLIQSKYVGPAPVPIANYVHWVRKQSCRDVEVHPADVEQAFCELVLDKETLWKLGAALNSGAPVFMYGPPGVGKTTIAEALSRVVAEDEVWIPYAVEVDGQVITIFDPAVHKRSADPETWDERWVRCHRPAVLVGGELTIEMLDLQFNSVTNYYVGPVQMKANNGVLIIDDFGRQRLRPDDLLNRWVVPLDRKIDFLTLAGGMKVQIPFDMLVVFASNMDPYQMVDPAFLRRIQTKIKIGAVSDQQFCEIFRRIAADRDLDYDATISHDLIHFIKKVLKQELRSCYPRDIVNQICWGAKYEGRTPELTQASLMRAVEVYFMPSS
jgi:predicted ATPase with chaperone activity